MLIILKSRALRYTLTVMFLISKNTSVFANDLIFKPKASGFFLGEYIYSNYNQSLSSGNRFGQVKSFDILCFPRAALNLQSNYSDDAPINVMMGFNFRNSCCYGNKNDPWAFTKFGVTDHAYVKIKNNQIVNSEILFGIQYVPYGDYQNNAIPATFTQLLTQTQAGSLVVNSFINDFTVSAFILNGKKAPNKERSINNFGMQVKYDYERYNLKIGYLYNIANAVNYIVWSPSSARQISNPLGVTYRKRVAGIAINALAKFYDEYRLEFGYTSALNKFDSRDLNWKLDGAKPRALLARFGKKIMLAGYNTNLSLNYQYSWQALNVRGPNLFRGLPKQRYQIDWVIEPLKDVEFGAHYIIDLAYQTALQSSQTFLVTISYLFDLSSR